MAFYYFEMFSPNILHSCPCQELYTSAQFLSVCARTHAQVTFDVVYDGDYVLSVELGGASAQLSCLNVLEDGAELLVLLTLVDQVPRQTPLFSHRA